MTGTLRFGIATGLAAVLMASVTVARAEEATDVGRTARAGRYAFDLLVLRPAGAVQTVIGSVFLIPAYPISIGSGASDEVVSRLVVDPARDTFERPIGDF